MPSLRQPYTKATECVWCQRAQPDTSRVKPKRNAKVSGYLMMIHTTRWHPNNFSILFRTGCDVLYSLILFAGCAVPRAKSYSSGCAVASCDTGWKVSDDNSTCAANVCSCANGVRASGAKCASDGAKVCESCNSGFKLRADNTACDGLLVCCWVGWSVRW